MTNYKELIERLYKNHKDYGEGRTQNFFRVSLDCKEAADAIETLTAELAEERHRHDRLQDWDRGLTEQGEILKRLINGEWVDSCDVEAALGLTFAECVKRFEMNRIATWNPYPLNGQRVDVQFRIKKGGYIMKNYIVINGVTYELVERTGLVTVPGSGLVAGPKLSDIPAGETFKLGDHEMIVLEQSGDTTAVIRKELLVDSVVFGKNNRYEGSNVDMECGKFADEIAAIVGAENLVEHTVDLTSDDGLKDYGMIRRKASLLTTDLYRRYVEILDKHKIDKWWWLATPHSTARHKNASWVKCVAPSGSVGSGGYYCDYVGVRPFCILKSNIFVSK